MKLLQPTEQAIAEASEALKRGLLVAFPTETVYGLGAAASDSEALKRLYAAKGRPSNHPVIVHLASVDQLSDWASEVPDAARKLAEQLWPGPLTLILPKSARVSDAVTGGQSSVGLRVPNHPVAQALLQKFGGGVAAPSANRFGRLSPTSAQDVVADFADEVEIVLDGGHCDVGIESTIVDFSQSRPRILRPGMIMPEQIEEICGIQLSSSPPPQKATTRAPGGLPSHYAPRTPLHVVPRDRLRERLESEISKGKRVCVLSFQPPLPQVPWVTGAHDAYKYARQLYGNLRKLDRENADMILVEEVPLTSDWEGIADRLRRASAAASHEVAHD